MLGRGSGSLTGSDNLFNLHKGDVDFLGELSHGLIRVLVGEGVNVHLDPCGRRDKSVAWEKGRGEMKMAVSVNTRTHTQWEGPI